jgi:hypothetical protein
MPGFVVPSFSPPCWARNATDWLTLGSGHDLNCSACPVLPVVWLQPDEFTEAAVASRRALRSYLRKTFS